MANIHLPLDAHGLRIENAGQKLEHLARRRDIHPDAEPIYRSADLPNQAWRSDETTASKPALMTEEGK